MLEKERDEGKLAAEAAKKKVNMKLSGQALKLHNWRCVVAYKVYYTYKQAY